MDRQITDMQAVSDILLQRVDFAILRPLLDEISPLVIFGGRIILNRQSSERIVLRTEFADCILVSVGSRFEIKQAILDSYVASFEAEILGLDLRVRIALRLLFQFGDDMFPVVNRTQSPTCGVPECTFGFRLPDTVVERQQSGVVTTYAEVNAVGAFDQLPYRPCLHSIGEVAKVVFVRVFTCGLHDVFRGELGGDSRAALR
ncbi:hypothetical protein C449_14327 [Halococcus saccharolyticus DSM 5350]|uniref:Uncharacterized protein n=1 Tax=Halococcus saccharolyticus DSM 5350 TaxID=1227455 RepID=M0MBK5_9EURY|nr:hypothetical protein C449_14327 [Halococcus saccharolyticus DSM 5350]